MSLRPGWVSLPREQVVAMAANPTIDRQRVELLIANGQRLEIGDWVSIAGVGRFGAEAGRFGQKDSTPIGTVVSMSSSTDEPFQTVTVLLGVVRRKFLAGLGTAIERGDLVVDGSVTGIVVPYRQVLDGKPIGIAEKVEYDSDSTTTTVTVLLGATSLPREDAPESRLPATTGEEVEAALDSLERSLGR